MKTRKKLTLPPFKTPRLSGWLLTAAGLLLVIALVSPQQLPVVLYKLVNDHRKLIHFLSKSDQSKLIHCFTQLLLLSAAYLSIGSFHRLIAVHANDEVNDQA
ncbi:hypothetical protein ArsFIN_34260 [Arsenophonus nasoniae]|uniref:Uncharacterized protein n=1 Tax=Arsenophonus nasoniae TaxID=638 RepID=A0A4P7KWX4_9GAMM|nr:hypothetical protein ArsFIN_34260 [Arsenophonus nasoniae]